MKSFEIWMKKYKQEDTEYPASLVATYDAESFEEAVEKFSKANPDIVTEDKGKFTIGGRKLYDNEKAANR